MLSSWLVHWSLSLVFKRQTFDLLLNNNRMNNKNTPTHGGESNRAQETQNSDGRSIPVCPTRIGIDCQSESKAEQN